MPLNVPGVLAPFQLLFRPYLAIPSLVVKDLRCLDFQALYNAGYRGAVFDKDNCLTLPYEDNMVPQLKETWEECKHVFGAENLLIVSNSAGSHLDPGGIEAEAVSYNLGVPVLRHDTMKPSYACIRAIRAYFASLPQPVPDSALFVAGDRIFTDVILANRMRNYRGESRKHWPLHSFEKKSATPNVRVGSVGQGPLSIFVENAWREYSFTMRYLEKKVVDMVRRWNHVDEGSVKISFVRD